MREFKFRVFDNDSGKTHVVGTDSHDSFNCFDNEVTYYNLQNGEGSGEYGAYILMPHTGLKDANGKDIYEGDIYKAINRDFESEVRGKVTYLNGCYMFGNWNAQEFFNKHQHIEVIGNIYENPKLLEESK